MAKYSKLASGETTLNGQLVGFFTKMLEKELVDAILIPTRQPKRGIMQTLISDPAKLESIDPFAPIVPLNSAKLVTNLTNVPSGKPVAVVMRSCEIRALTELVKLKQAHLEDLLIIGMDCLGRYENVDFLRFEEDGGTTQSFLECVLSGNGTKTSKEIDIADACKICEYPSPTNVDIRLCVIGADPGEVYIESVSEAGSKCLDKLGIKKEETPTGRDKALERIKSMRISMRDKVFKEYYEKINSLEKLKEHLEGCINCYNCRVACPVCYCKECVFVTDNFRHPGDKYMSWVDNYGALKMPTETLLYHMTRMTHMSTLCVGCGQCTSACPNDIKLAELFRSVANNTQTRFDYHPGRSLDEPQPLAVFYDNELAEVTGHKHQE